MQKKSQNLLKKISGCINNKCITCIPVLIQLEVGKLDSYTTGKYAEKVGMGRDLECISWGKVEENRNVNPRGKI